MSSQKRDEKTGSQFPRRSEETGKSESSGSPSLKGPSRSYQSRIQPLDQPERDYSKIALRRKKLLRIATVLLIALCATAAVASLWHLVKKNQPPVFPGEQSWEVEAKAEEAENDSAAKDPKGKEAAIEGASTSKESAAAQPGALGLAKRYGGDLHLSHGRTEQESLGADEANLMNKQNNARRDETIQLSSDVLARLFPQEDPQNKKRGEGKAAVHGAKTSSIIVENRAIEALMVTKATRSQMRLAAAFFKTYMDLTVGHDWKKATGVIRDPERIIPKMREFYFDQTRRLPELARAEPTSIYRLEWEGLQILRCNVELNSYEERVAFLVLDEGSGQYKLDWESFVHYLPVAWDELLNERPIGETPVRVVVASSIDYDEPFADSRKFAAFSLSRIAEDKSLIGYVGRGAAIHQQLIDALGTTATESDRKLTMVLGIRYPKNAISPRQVEITRVVSPSWLVP